MKPFHFETNPTRVVFGSGTLARLPEEVRLLGLRRVLLITTPQQVDLADRAAALLGEQAAARFTDATMHTPVEVTLRAMELVQAREIDGLVALGGGSTIGLGKAIALRTGLPQIVVPTTYAGSEMTPILGQTEGGRKTTQRGAAIQPEMVLYDVDLTLTLPVAGSVTSGLNAIAHAVEALYAPDGNPITSIMAEEGVRGLAAALPAIVANPADAEARAQALYGAWLCGTCLGQVGMALHHKLCHTLGGTFDLPHAETHSIVLPHAIAYNSVATRAMQALARALGTAEAPALAIHHLALRLGAPTALRDIGMPESGIEEAATLAAANPYPNPRPIDRAGIAALLRRAWAGEPPAP
jgi:alcohol dehydrogenase class IV